MSTLAIVLISVYITAAIVFFVVMMIGLTAQQTKVSTWLIAGLSTIWPIWLGWYAHSLVKRLP